ncbi:hypothetical protein EON67_10035 [archaeon]|nr:MAG: hypothetical protein EON67_10035 [archaeon]
MSDESSAEMPGVGSVDTGGALKGRRSSGRNAANRVPIEQQEQSKRRPACARAESGTPACTRTSGGGCAGTYMSRPCFHARVTH